MVRIYRESYYDWPNRPTGLHIRPATYAKSLCKVSFSRCYAIVYPMKAKSVCTVSKANKVVALVWVLSFLLATPTLYVQVKKYSTNNNGWPQKVKVIRSLSLKAERRRIQNKLLPWLTNWFSNRQQMKMN